MVTRQNIPLPQPANPLPSFPSIHSFFLFLPAVAFLLSSTPPSPFVQNNQLTAIRWSLSPVSSTFNRHFFLRLAIASSIHQANPFRPRFFSIQSATHLCLPHLFYSCHFLISFLPSCDLSSLPNLPIPEFLSDSRTWKAHKHGAKTKREKGRSSRLITIVGWNG